MVGKREEGNGKHIPFSGTSFTNFLSNLSREKKKGMIMRDREREKGRGGGMIT